MLRFSVQINISISLTQSLIAVKWGNWFQSVGITRIITQIAFKYIISIRFIFSSHDDLKQDITLNLTQEF